MINEFDYHYKVYIDKCLALVATMIIKSSKDALDMHRRIISNPKFGGYELSDDKRTWVYYKHIAGEYHETDEPMYVVSVDTTEKIIFNKENLKSHKNTKKEYAYGTHKYEELVIKYPQNELLIKGILNPVDIDYAINAPDGTILSYDKRYVEQNEYSLMEKIQDFVYGLYSRWYQKQYNIDNRYYNLTYMGIMYQKILEAIIQIRLDHCLTNEAHSYHYRRYLASHGFLDFYIEHLTIKQAIILYKNIRWVERYIGQRHTQQWLIKHILTLRNIPLSEYNMVQVYNNIIDDVKAIAKFEKVDLNGLELIDPLVDTLTLKQLMDKEDPLAPFNLREREWEEKETKEKLAESLSAELKTKVLESKVIDYSGSESQTLENVLLDQFIDMVDKDMYKAYITINHPITGEAIPLNGRNALLMYTYATFKANDIKDNCIPDYTIGLTVRKRKPTKKEIRAIIPDNSLILDKWIDFILEEYTPMSVIMNTVDFYNQGVETFNRINKLLDLAKKDEHIDATGYKIASVYNLFATRIISLRKPGMTTFSDFIASIAFDEVGLDKNDWMRIAQTIWSKALGLDNYQNKSLSMIHKAMIGLMTKLSSYSVHYIREINEFPIVSTNMRATRLNGDGYRKAFHERDNDGNGYGVEIIDDDTKVFNETIDGIQEINGIKITDIKEKTKTEFFIDPSVKQISDLNTIRINADSIINTGTNVWIVGEEVTGVNPLSLPNLPGMQSWINLPNEIKKRIADQFGTDLVWVENPRNESTPKEPLSWGIRNSELSGFDYNNKKNP